MSPPPFPRKSRFDSWLGHRDLTVICRRNAPVIGSKLRSDVKAEWIAALTSGEYPQAIKVMRLFYDEYHYCCWGVLEEISPLECTHNSYPCAELLEWAGIDRASGPTKDIVMYLAALNDEGSGFGWIAEEIDHWL